MSGQLDVSSSARLQTVSLAAMISIKYALSVQLHTFSPAAIFSPVCSAAVFQHSCTLSPSLQPPSSALQSIGPAVFRQLTCNLSALMYPVTQSICIDSGSFATSIAAVCLAPRLEDHLLWQVAGRILARTVGAHEKLVDRDKRCCWRLSNCQSL